MFDLSNPQKHHLKALAHHCKPVVIVGNHGVTPAVLQEIGQALGHHELIKIRINAKDREARDLLIADIRAATGAVLVQRVGFVATLFRRNHEAPRLELP